MEEKTKQASIALGIPEQAVKESVEDVLRVFRSHAKWPEGCPVSTSSDKHNSKEEALGVCRLLEKEGFGGEGKFFPTSTFVTEMENPDEENPKDILKHHIREFFGETAAVHTIDGNIVVIKTTQGKIFDKDMTGRVEKIGGVNLCCSTVAMNGRTAWFEIVPEKEEKPKVKTSRKKKTSRRKKK